MTAPAPPSPAPAEAWAALGLRPALARAADARWGGSPTPVQAQAIPVAVEGRDLAAQAPTGTGKTAA